MTRARPRSRAAAGFALTVALLAVVAISLAAAQLVRAVDTTTTIAGNLVSRAEAIAIASVALEQALAVLEDADSVRDRSQDHALHGYYASRLPGEDARGIPRALRGNGIDASTAARQPVTNGATRVHVVERMCLAPGPAVAANCVLPRPAESAGGDAAPDIARDEAAVLYRATVRVDGPRGAIVVVQALARGSATLERLAWRVINE